MKKTASALLFLLLKTGHGTDLDLTPAPPCAPPAHWEAELIPQPQV